MRVTYAILFAVVTLMATIGEISATSDKNELSKMNWEPLTQPIDTMQDSRRFLRKRQVVDEYEAAKDEERSQSEQFAAKLVGRMQLIDDVAGMTRDKAYHHLQSFATTFTSEERKAIIRLSKLSSGEKATMIANIKALQPRPQA